jgi:hypothetical protein
VYVAFPRSEYYGGSEPIGLASRRVSRVYAHETLSTLRCPSVPYQAHCLPLTVKSFPHPASYDAYYSVTASDMLRWMTENIVQNSDSIVPISPYVQNSRCSGLHIFSQPPLYWHAPFPFEFPLQVSHCSRGSWLLTPPASSRDFISADTAHEACVGAMTRRTEFLHVPACGIRNEGWTTNQACSLPPVGGSNKPSRRTRGVVDYTAFFCSLCSLSYCSNQRRPYVVGMSTYSSPTKFIVSKP